MKSSRSTRTLLFVSVVAWLIVMGLLYYTHYFSDAGEEIGSYSADITFDEETRNYYTVRNPDGKIGYASESRVPYRQLLILREDAALKLDIAGKSREVFTQTSVTVDTLGYRMVSFDFILHAGAHTYNCSGAVHGDSLIIQVRKSTFDPVRTGIFSVNPDVTLPLALPYRMNANPDYSLKQQVFDPVSFTIDSLTIDRRGDEQITIGDSTFSTTRYDIMNDGRLSSVWLDSGGETVRHAGSLFFSGEAGETTVERAFDKRVFLLPLETGIGDAMIDSLALMPDRMIERPRSVTYLDVRLDGIRAANIDVESSNKEVVSVDPVTFIIRRDSGGNGAAGAIDPMTVRADTTVLASTDYIESLDGRIRRRAMAIASGESDTLSIAYAINRWVHNNMTSEAGLHITRSVDILKEGRGAADEYSKLYAALSRSIGIPTYIHLGFVYDNGAFRYHSWPSVFANGAWHHLDPYYGQDAADATHITLIRGGFEQKIEIFRIFRHISLHIRDYRH